MTGKKNFDAFKYAPKPIFLTFDLRQKASALTQKDVIPRKGQNYTK
jgi:hypothetical protein